ncbi:MAG: nuclear transport factor 2 family protein [Maricaulaceae bacterium]|jgi:ketosteroid isomerase-like protein
MPTNKELMTSIFDELAKANGRPFVEALADDVVWRSIGSHAWAGRFEGKEAIVDQIFRPLRERIGVPTTRARRIIADGDIVVVQANGENVTAEGTPYCNDYCFVYRLKDGKIVEVEEYLDTELVTSALGARA